MSKGYVDNKRFHQELKDWLENFPDQPMPEYCGLSIMRIAEGFARRWNWSRYTDLWKENMIGKAVENMVRYAANYNYDKYSNPHGYFSMITDHTFKNVIKKEKEEYKSKLSMTLDAVEELSNSDEMEYTVPDEIHFDLLQKLDNYGGIDSNKQRKPRATKAEKAAERAMSMDEYL